MEEPISEDDEVQQFLKACLLEFEAKAESKSSFLKRYEALAVEEELAARDAEAYLERIEKETAEAWESPLNKDEETMHDALDRVKELEETTETLEDEIETLKLAEQGLLLFDQTNIEPVQESVTLALERLHVNIQQGREQVERYRTQAGEYKRKLEALTRSDYLNECFFIWHEGLFGTINGLRLGCLPDQTVEWNEINAAFGLAALLLESLAKEMQYDFVVWRVQPRGNQSLMVNVQSSSQTLNLYCNTTWLWKSSFNAAIAAFADCIDQLAEYARAKDPSVLLPHAVVRDTIGGLSLHYSSSEEWTRAMKFLLTDLKWILAWVVKTRHANTVRKLFSQIS